MMRFLSILLLLAGLLVAGYGGSRLLEVYAPKADMAFPATPAAESAMEETEEDMAMEMAPAPQPMEAEDPVAAPAAAPPLSRSLPAPELDAPLFTTETVPFDAADDAAAGVADPAESFLNTLKTVPVAHETPSTAEYKRPFEAVLAIDATGDETAVDALPGRGNVEEGTAKVSKKVEARLSGSGFAIKAMTPEQQTISPLTENTWRWSVTPLTAGNQELTFDIYAIDDGPAVPLRTFHNTVTVNVTGLNRAIAFADQANPLAVFFGGVGSVLAGLFGAIKFVRRR